MNATPETVSKRGQAPSAVDASGDLHDVRREPVPVLKRTAGISPVACGGIVLCGGRSGRMGRPKLWLPFGPETMLQRVVRILCDVVSPVVVVAAADQELPPLPSDVLVTRDAAPDLGPLAGLAVGLAALRPYVEAAYASSCDVPLLRPEFVGRMIAALGSHDLAVPREGDYHHPLAAVYRTRLADVVSGLVAERRLRPVFLLEHADAHVVPVESLRDIDPDLDSLRNANRPEDYRAALAVAGFSPD